MIALLADPRFIDIILALVVLEALGLMALRALAGHGPAPVSFLCTLLAGAFLLLALRETLAGAAPELVAGSLALSFVAHLADLTLRWETRAQSTIGKVTASAKARAKAAPSAPARGSRVRA